VTLVRPPSTVPHITPTRCAGFDGIPFSGTKFISMFGWVAGVGLEYRLFEHVLLRAEWLHYDFGQNTYGVQLPVVVPLVVNNNITRRVDVIRGGISYKF
jgi:opacity protein-like surface antigen